MLMELDTRRLVAGLKTLESLALIPRVASTNLIARRIVSECIENELSLPQAMIVAGEQFAGRGRNDRTWSSPAGKGIYATTLLTRSVRELGMIPLEMANIVATYLRETYDIDARIKWPNDVLVPGSGPGGDKYRKIAGILIEARVQDDRVYLLIGTGVNVEPVADDARPNAVAISEVAKRGFTNITDATAAFVRHVDGRLAQTFETTRVLEEWRRLCVHQPGDRIASIIGERTVNGTWAGIDEQGRALLKNGPELLAVSAGELMLV
jgi:BirA family biotin operon repressor/biotin-[acetyl-CoA-carboxylase] ligase